MDVFSPPHILNSARWKNMRVGVLGGSFNPAHKGHIHISEIALKALKLDAVWWLVTPKNPLKSDNNLASMDKRIIYARKILNNHPKIIVTDMEKSFATNYSYDSIVKLNKYYPNTEFAWISGMDNAHNFHLWKNWKGLLSKICMVHIARGASIDLVKNSPARMLATQNHVILNHSINACLNSGTTYWIINKQIYNISSTEIRAQ